MYIKYAIVMFVLCFPPISSTQLGWYFFGSEVGINIGMVVGILPIVGAPLPFMSYGGTSMLTVFAALGIIMSIKSHQRLLRK